MTTDSLLLRQILKPMASRSGRVRALTVGLTAATAWWLYASFRLLTEGHTLLGTKSYGATWGITVVNIVHVIAISHVGVAISATVRVLKLERFRGIARLAEIITIVALVVAVINIVLDVGRPDRFLTEVLRYGRWSVPMVWSATVISIYMAASCSYLYLSMRRDLWLLSRMRSRLGGLYRRLSLGYRDTEVERDRHDRTLFWLALALVPIMISVHSVYGLFFGLLNAKSGWYNPLQAPYFVLAAIVTGVSAIIVLAALMRWAYGWHDLPDERVFKTLGGFLAFVVFLYLYFVCSEQLTARFAAGPDEKAVSDMLLVGAHSGLFWAAVLGGLVVPFAVLFFQAISAGRPRIWLTAWAAAAVNVALWVKRYLLVVPAQEHVRLPPPIEEAAYAPTRLEFVATLGTYALGGLLLIGAAKVVPLVEIPMSGAIRARGAGRSRASTRSVVMVATLVAALGLILWGVIGRDGEFAPVKWISGMVLLAALPVERCLISDAKVLAVVSDSTSGAAGERGST